MHSVQNAISNMKKEAKVLSNILYIMTKIAKVVCYIGITIVSLFVVITPFLFNKIKIDNTTQTIKVGNEEVYYSLDNTTLSVYTVNNQLFTVTLSSNGASKVNRLLRKDPKFYLLVSEYVFLSAIVMMTLLVFLFTNIEKLFKNITNEKTPFIKENVFLLQEVAKYTVISAVTTYFLTLFLELILRLNLNVRVDLSIVLYVLGIYLLAYIFEYGMEKENRS